MQTGKMMVEIVSDKGDVSSYEAQIQINEDNTMSFALPVAVPLNYSFRLRQPQIDSPAAEIKMPAGVTATVTKPGA